MCPALLNCVGTGTKMITGNCVLQRALDKVGAVLIYFRSILNLLKKTESVTILRYRPDNFVSYIQGTGDGIDTGGLPAAKRGGRPAEDCR
jgi:hypothetical protein